jgi:hypothetical protein
MPLFIIKPYGAWGFNGMVQVSVLLNNFIGDSIKLIQPKLGMICVKEIKKVMRSGEAGKRVIIEMRGFHISLRKCSCHNGGFVHSGEPA